LWCFKEFFSRILNIRREVMKKYRCMVCGYIYDPIVGDDTQDVKPDTPFENLPEDWTCPVCGATKDQFEEE
jgi:rubredoxin